MPTRSTVNKWKKYIFIYLVVQNHFFLLFFFINYLYLSLISIFLSLSVSIAFFTPRSVCLSLSFSLSLSLYVCFYSSICLSVSLPLLYLGWNWEDLIFGLTSALRADRNKPIYSIHQIYLDVFIGDERLLKKKKKQLVIYATWCWRWDLKTIQLVWPAIICENE